MKLINYKYDEQTVLGVVNIDEKIISLGDICADLDIVAPKTMIELIEHTNRNDILQAIYNNNISSSLSLEDVELLAPIQFPLRNVICLGKNYVDHVNEVKGLSETPEDIPKVPIYFTKLAERLTGSGEGIDITNTPTEKVDYEAELAIVIGKKGKNIKKEEAANYIFGYTIGNDFSARDLQTTHNQWFKRKSLDGFTSIGPHIVPFVEIRMNPSLKITSSVNGEIRQDSNTDLLIFAIDYIIEDLSKGLTLLPGDIILTGTPSGVGAGFEPPKFLKPGDEVVCEVEKIRKLVNYMK